MILNIVQIVVAPDAASIILTHPPPSPKDSAQELLYKTLGNFSNFLNSFEAFSSESNIKILLMFWQRIDTVCQQKPPGTFEISTY